MSSLDAQLAEERQKPWMGKRYRMVESKNFEEFLKARGVGYIGRKMANSVTPTVSLTVDIDEEGLRYTFHTFSTFKNTSYDFVPAVEFDETTPDDRTVRSLIQFEENTGQVLRLRHEQFGEFPTVVERTFTATEITLKMTYNGVVCTRRYELE